MKIIKHNADKILYEREVYSVHTWCAVNLILGCADSVWSLPESRLHLQLIKTNYDDMTICLAYYIIVTPSYLDRVVLSYIKCDTCILSLSGTLCNNSI